MVEGAKRYVLSPPSLVFILFGASCYSYVRTIAKMEIRGSEGSK